MAAHVQDELDEENESEPVAFEDYYTFLNVPRNATSEEINAAFRRASRLYHPDKHLHQADKSKAVLLFTKAKKAHEVLSDPHQRAIYDALGIKGLETEGWEIVQRTKTPSEIRDEYERLAKEREEKRLQQRTNPQGTFVVGVDATDIFERYIPTDEDYMPGYSGFPNVEVNQMSLLQSIDVPMSSKDTATIQGSLSVQNGNGQGSIGTVLRRILTAQSWGEIGISVGNGPLLHCKGYRTFTNKAFCTMSGSLQFTQLGVKPGITAVLGQHLDTNIMAYMAWKTGTPSSLSTTVVWDGNNKHVSFTAQFGIPTSHVTISYMHRFPEEQSKLKVATKFGTFGALFEYGAEKKITQNSILGATMSLGIPSGVSLKIRVHRFNQTYVFPIQLSESIVPSAILYGTTVPVLVFFVTRALVVRPWLRRQKEQQTKESVEINAQKLSEKKMEAEAATSLMLETVNRIRETETNKRGLVIIQAWYGLLVTETSSQVAGRVIDVTIPLQCQVKDSKLILHEGTKVIHPDQYYLCGILTKKVKSNLAGFYDPAPVEEKSLHILYKFHDVMHEVTVEDKSPVRLPKQSHRIQTDLD